LEEIVWQAVFSIISNPERLMRQWEEYIERKRRQLRANPDAEARCLAERLHKLDQEETYLLDVASDTSMPTEKLWAKLGELAERRKELEGALRSARNRQQTIEELERKWKMGAQVLDLVRIHYVCTGPEDRRRIYQALRLQASVDEEGQVRLSGIFSPDVYLPTLVQGPPLDPSKSLPKVPEGTKVVVTLDNGRWPDRSRTNRGPDPPAEDPSPCPART
jgi:hypothetical protein